MNTKLRKIKNNAKALSPVVASIILIAVTVAVSVAVAAWMGGMTLGFMQTEQLSITSATVTAGAPGSVILGISNTGTTSVTISQVWVGNVQITSGTTYTGVTSGSTFATNAQGTLTIPIGAVPPQTYVSGYSYAFKLVSSKGNAFTYNVVAP